MAPLEPWQKVLVDAESFGMTDHGEIPCTACHGGVNDSDKEVAHTNIIARPSDGEAPACAECHEEQAAVFPASLHASQEGYWTVLEERGADRTHPEMQEMFGNHCASCHTSCGDCHVAQPASVGGGLLDGHLFTADPPMTRTCTACHGSRVGNEYLGRNEGLLADVHFRQGRMTCTDCHEGSEMHGGQINEDTGELVAHRYESAEDARCESCHESFGTGDDEVREHRMHGDTVQCQVCHSVSYINCNSCHVQVSEATGNPFFVVEEDFFSFMIGQNPRKSAERPYDWVTLRHVPIDPESFAFYGENLLPEFNDLPTWVYATPHNIQRNTPQTESCNNCHGNTEIFLTADKVLPDELDANAGVIVDEIPEAQDE